jgi:hypothetical protein
MVPMFQRHCPQLRVYALFFNKVFVGWVTLISLPLDNPTQAIKNPPLGKTKGVFLLFGFFSCVIDWLTLFIVGYRDENFAVIKITRRRWLVHGSTKR